MDEMRYETPTSVNAAIKLLAGADGVAKVLNGGTDLLVQMRADMVAPSLIVDIKKIADMVNDKKIEGITDIRDESDREGMRIVFDLKRDAVANVVLNKLFKLFLSILNVLFSSVFLILFNFSNISFLN